MTSATLAAAAQTPGRRTLARVGTLALADQALMSATNFVTVLLVVRSVTSAAFGAFTLAYTALLFLNSIQNALLTQPHNVLGASRGGSEFARYTRSVAVLQVFFAGAGVAAVLGVAGASALAGWSITNLLVALAAAVGGWQLQEFVRRVLYTRGDVRGALLNDIAAYGAQAVGIAVLWRTQRLDGASALSIVGVTSAVAAVWGCMRMRVTLGERDVDVRAVAAEHWRFARWLVGGTLAGWLALYVYPILTAILIGVAETGAIRALQNLLGPTNIVMNAFEAVALPAAAAKQAERGGTATRHLVFRWSMVPLASLAVYGVLLGAFGRPLVRWLYPAGYVRYAPLLWLFAIVCVLLFAAQTFSVVLRATRKTLPVFYAQIAAVGTTFTVGLVLIKLAGTAGILLGVIATAGTAAAVLGLAARVHR